MPWKRKGKGYKTSRGGFVKRPKQYEALRRKGMSKSAAARIANSKRKKRGKK